MWSHGLGSADDLRESLQAPSSLTLTLSELIGSLEIRASLVRSSSRAALKPRAIRETRRTRCSMDYNRSNEKSHFFPLSISWCLVTLAPRLMHACVHMCVGACVKLPRWKYSVIKALLISTPYTSVPPSVMLYRSVPFLCCA